MLIAMAHAAMGWYSAVRDEILARKPNVECTHPAELARDTRHGATARRSRTGGAEMSSEFGCVHMCDPPGRPNGAQAARCRLVAVSSASLCSGISPGRAHEQRVPSRALKPENVKTLKTEIPPATPDLHAAARVTGGKQVARLIHHEASDRLTNFTEQLTTS